MNTLEQGEPNTPEPIAEPLDDAAGEAQAVKSMTAVAAMKEGAAHAKAAAEQFVPGVGRLLARSVYGTFYYASYGVVFSALTIAHLVPTNNLVGNAIKDGAKAAQQAMAAREEAGLEAEEGVVAA